MATKKKTTAKKTTAKKKVAKKTVAKKAVKKEASKVEEKPFHVGCIPPEKTARLEKNHYGLFINVDYVFKESGEVDWKSMIDKSNLVVNEDWFVRRQKDAPKEVDGLKDEQMIITLQGFKDLAKLRGYSSVRFKVMESSKEYVSVKCIINWLGNYETLGEPIVYEELANASVYNTDSFASVFLETIAANRAFSRCVRNFLNINVVGSEEIGSREAPKLELDGTPSNDSGNNDNMGGSIDVHEILIKCFEDKFAKHSFEDFITFLRVAYKRGLYVNEEVGNWANFSDISGKDCREIMKVIKEWKKEE